MDNLIPFPSTATLIPIPLYRDADDDRLVEPRGRVAFAPRPALRDPLDSPTYRERFIPGVGYASETPTSPTLTPVRAAA